MADSQEVSIARLEVKLENIMSKMDDLSKQLADHAKEEMAVYVRKDEFHLAKNEHTEIFDRLEKVEEKTEGLTRKIWVITSFASMVGALILAVLSNTFSNIVSLFTHK